jgi:hypothetical protein
MPRKTRALSGAAQDAYFRRVLKTCAALPAEEREQLVRRLRQEIAQLRLRVVRTAEPADVSHATPMPPSSEPVADQTVSPHQAETPLPTWANLDFGPPAPPAYDAAPAFDPYSPNVIVVLRKGGREAALRALDAIESLDNLRLLAREQRLSVSADLSSAAELRAAIVAAAERRVANRLAAAS